MPDEIMNILEETIVKKFKNVLVETAIREVSEKIVTKAIESSSAYVSKTIDKGRKIKEQK